MGSTLLRHTSMHTADLLNHSGKFVSNYILYTKLIIWWLKVHLAFGVPINV